MAKINSTVDKVTRILVKEMAKSQKTGVITAWKNRKVISIAKWIEWPHEKETRKKLGYLPEDYVYLPWGMVPSNKLDKDQLDKWYKDWNDYLYEKQKPLFGASLCRGCILIHNSGNHMSIRNIVLLGAPKSFKHPCGIENRFKCPFLQSEHGDDLFFLQEISYLVVNSLVYVESLSNNNKKTIIAYFDRDFAEEYSSHIDPRPLVTGSINNTLDRFYVSDLGVDSIQEIYNALTSDKLLGLAIDQYTRYLRNAMPESNIERADYFDTLKPKVISYFRQIRDKIKIEDISDLAGRNLEQEKEWIQSRGVMKTRDGGVIQNFQKSGLCIQCNSFANIKCANCDKWICTKHWKEHAVGVHGYKFTK